MSDLGVCVQEVVYLMLLSSTDRLRKAQRSAGLVYIYYSIYYLLYKSIEVGWSALY